MRPLKSGSTLRLCTKLASPSVFSLTRTPRDLRQSLIASTSFRRSVGSPKPQNTISL